MNYIPRFLVQSRLRKDRKRRIWAHRANSTSGLKKWEKNISQLSSLYFLYLNYRKCMTLNVGSGRPCTYRLEGIMKESFFNDICMKANVCPHSVFFYKRGWFQIVTLMPQNLLVLCWMWVEQGFYSCTHCRIPQFCYRMLFSCVRYHRPPKHTHLLK